MFEKLGVTGLDPWVENGLQYAKTFWLDFDSHKSEHVKNFEKSILERKHILHEKDFDVDFWW